MAKTKTPSFILTLKLDTQPYQELILEKRFRISKQMYNACINEQYRRYNRMIESKEYQSIMRQIKRTYREENKIKHINKRDNKKIKYSDKERKALFKELNNLHMKYGITEYSMHEFVSTMSVHFKKNIDSLTAQKIASRAYESLSKLLYGNGNKMYYKSELDSIEGKWNKSGIRFIDNQLIWNGLKIPSIIKKSDEYAQIALTNRVKYVRIVRKYIRCKSRFFIQLVLEGIPPRKIDKETGMFKVKARDGRVGLDIGTQTIAISGGRDVKLLELAPSIQNMEREKRVLQRKLDRQRRANNPQKYNEDGTIKKNKEKWILSKNYIKTKLQLADILRKRADIRKMEHYKFCNMILELGTDVFVEKMNYQGLQKRAKETTINEKTGKFNKKKRFGKSLANKAPAMFLTILNQKLKYYGKELNKINTSKVKASQYNHVADEYIKCELSDRWKIIGDMKVQRDLYSAFLIMNVNSDLEGVDKLSCNETWDNFIKLHDFEIERIKSSNKLISSMGL